MSYSKGEWRYSENHREVTTSRKGILEGAKVICQLNTAKSNEECLANGRMISAAPDMLMALQIAVGIIENHPISLSKKDKIKICLEAINKASGTSLEAPEGNQINRFLKSIK